MATYSLPQFEQKGGTCYAHASATCLLKLVKRYVPAPFQDDGMDPGQECTHDFTGATDGITIYEYTRCPEGSAAWRTLSVYMFLMTFITGHVCRISGTGDEGGYPKKELTYALQTLYNTEYNLGEEEDIERIFGGDMMKTTAIPILEEFRSLIQEVSISVKTAPAFTLQGKVAKPNLQIRNTIDEGLYCVLTMSPALINDLHKAHRYVTKTMSSLYDPDDMSDHAVAIVGISDTNDELFIKNSWGNTPILSISTNDKLFYRAKTQFNDPRYTVDNTITFFTISTVYDPLNPNINVRAEPAPAPANYIPPRYHPNSNSNSEYRRGRRGSNYGGGARTTRNKKRRSTTRRRKVVRDSLFSR